MKAYEMIVDMMLEMGFIIPKWKELTKEQKQVWN